MPDWPAIVDRDGPAAWRTAYRLLHNRADADECFQEACLAAWEVARRGPVRNWRALLQRLAAARAVDRLRQRVRRGRLEAVADWEALRGPGPTPLEGAEDAELAERLRAALARIPPAQAEVFCLHCLDGWTYAEIARESGTSTDAVGVLLHRARQRLRELMSEVLGIAPESEPRKEPS